MKYTEYGAEKAKTWSEVYHEAYDRNVVLVVKGIISEKRMLVRRGDEYFLLNAMGRVCDRVPGHATAGGSRKIVGEISFDGVLGL